jgi:hypothetical protein
MIKMDQIILISTLLLAFFGGFAGNLMAINAKYYTEWGFFWKSKKLYFQSFIHGFASALIFYILIEILNIQISLGVVPLQNNFIVALIIGLIAKPLYDYEFFSFSLGSNNTKISISSLIPILKNFDNDMESEIFLIVQNNVKLRCKKWNDLQIVKNEILKTIPHTPEGDAFKKDIDNTKIYLQCWDLMYWYAHVFGKKYLDSIFPEPEKVSQ